MTRAAVELLECRKLLTSDLLTLGAALNDGAFAVVALQDGGRVIAGTFSGTIDFNPGTGTRNLTASGQTDIFLARYASDGSLVWANGFGGAAGKGQDDLFYSTVQATVGDFVNNVGPTIDRLGEYVSALKLGANGNVYIGGSFQGTANFDPVGAVNRRSVGYHDAFVAEYNGADGSLVWASSFGGEFDDTVKDLVVTDDGAVIATGYFTREADFNPTKVEKRIIANGRDDIFVAKFAQTDSAPIARLQWVYTAGGDAVDLPERDSGEGLALDGRGNVYVTGTFAGEADFDPSKSRLRVKATDKTDGFLLRLSPKGKLDYIQGFGGEEFDGGKNIAIDNQGRLYLSGYFSEEADLDPGDGVANFIAREDGDSRDLDDNDEGGDQIDLFVSQVSLRGELQWAKPVGGDDYEYLGSMQVVDDGSIVLSGAFAGRVEFDGTTAAAQRVSIEGDDDFEDDGDRESSYDAFVAQYRSDGTFLASLQYGGVGDDWANAAVYSADRSSIEVVGIYRGTASFNGQATGIKRKAIALQDLFSLSTT